MRMDQEKETRKHISVALCKVGFTVGILSGDIIFFKNLNFFFKENTSHSDSILV